MRLCLVGYGKLGSSIARRLRRKGHTIKVSTLPPTDVKAREEGFEVVPLEECVKASEITIVSVPPSAAKGVVEKVKKVNPKVPIISTAALVKLKELGEGVTRIMPSVAVEVGTSPILVSGYKDEKVNSLLEDLGKPYWVEEDVLDAALPVVGSGPAVHALYYQSMVEAMVYSGVPRELAEKLAIDSIRSTMDLLENYDPYEVRSKVETPGGITVEITNELESQGVFGKISKVLGEVGRRLRTRR